MVLPRSAPEAEDVTPVVTESGVSDEVDAERGQARSLRGLGDERVLEPQNTVVTGQSRTRP
jgi:hypothetical protein